MVRTYTDIWNGFQIRDVVTLGEKKSDIERYDVVLWEDCEPHEVTEWGTGKKKIIDRHCFSVAFITYNEKECCYEFESTGTRFLEYYVDGLSEWILNFIHQLEEIRDCD